MPVCPLTNDHRRYVRYASGRDKDGEPPSQNTSAALAAAGGGVDVSWALLTSSNMSGAAWVCDFAGCCVDVLLVFGLYLG